MIATVLGHTKRLIVTIIGFTVLAAGIVMIVLPGPAILVVPLGLGILATEYVWARTLLKHAKEYISRRQAKRHSKKTDQSINSQI